MIQALAALGMGSMKYPTMITSLLGISEVSQYQAMEHVTPTIPPASPATSPFSR